MADHNALIDVLAANSNHDFTKTIELERQQSDLLGAKDGTKGYNKLMESVRVITSSPESKALCSGGPAIASAMFQQVLQRGMALLGGRSSQD